MKNLLLGKSDKFVVQFVRYGFVAGAAFVVDFGLLYVFTEYVHIFYLVSATASFLISLVLNYVLSVLWVFSADSQKRHLQIILFILKRRFKIVLYHL
jgi:putative flippase GtrA